MPQAVIASMVSQIVQQLVQMLMEKIIEALRNQQTQEQTQSDLQETMSQEGVVDPAQQAEQLREVADVFDRLGQPEAADFTRGIAARIEAQITA